MLMPLPRNKSTDNQNPKTHTPLNATYISAQNQASHFLFFSISCKQSNRGTTMRSKANKQSKLMHYILSPIRILTKATEFYVKSMEDCAGRAGHGAAVGCPIARVRRFPHDDDQVLRQLLRTVSKRKNVDNKVSFDMHREQEVRKSNMNDSAMGRSYMSSVGLGKIGRIDEDKPCYFEEDDVNVKTDLYSRK